MRAGTCLLLLTAGMITLSAGPGFGQELLLGDPHLTWAEIGGAGGTLEGIGRDDQPTVCATWGPLTYPDLLHPKPTNPDGSPADCSRPGVDALADGPISVPGAMSGTASAIATWAHNPFSDVQEYLLEQRPKPRLIRSSQEPASLK